MGKTRSGGAVKSDLELSQGQTFSISSIISVCVHGYVRVNTGTHARRQSMYPPDSEYVGI